MYNKSEIMRRAHEIKKEDKNYIWGLCLKIAWAEAKSPVKKTVSYSIKNWFLVKNLSQNEKYIVECAMMGGTMEVLKETDKALQFKAASDYGTFVFWCPKSCLAENMTEQEHQWEQERQNKVVSGLDYNRKLLEFAKANGIKGVRLGMKTLTLKQKISAAGFKIPEK